MGKWVRACLAHVWLYLGTLLKWLGLAIVTGVLCGVIGSLFHIGVEYATVVREENSWVVLFLPLAGIIIVFFYKITGTLGQGTNAVIDEVRAGKGISLWLLPAIFLGTVFTHLCGGSSGREGAALQMGGAIGYHIGRIVRLDDRDERIATMTGMAAFFAALFGTPMTATYFSIVVISVGVMYHAALVPCLVSSVVSYGISLLMKVEPTRFHVVLPEMEIWMLVRVAGLGILCALVSVVFCRSLHFFENFAEKRLPNPWIRVVAGAALILAMTWLCGTTEYNGLGMESIAAAVEQGQARPAAFLMKLLFTVITLAAGFKGGEVVPSLFIGATFGCVAGPLLGIPAGAGAAIGMVALFSGATNCPVASVFLAIELLGAEGLIYYAVACALSYLLSGYNGLYSNQTIMYSKLKAEYINVRTNAYHAGNPHAKPPVHGNVKD